MRISEIVRRDNEPKFDFVWDNDRVGFATTVDGEEVGFFPAKSKFDRSGAQEAARKLMVKLRAEHASADYKKREDEFQYNKPLSTLEQEWIELSKKFMQLNDKELARWTQLGPVIRKSLIDGSHPSAPEMYRR